MRRIHAAWSAFRNPRPLPAGSWIRIAVNATEFNQAIRRQS